MHDRRRDVVFTSMMRAWAAWRVARDAGGSPAQP
jgi:hypothetical protein